MTTIVFTRDDGSEVLVVLYPDGTATMAEREVPYAAWGPPIPARIVDFGG